MAGMQLEKTLKGIALTGIFAVPLVAFIVAESLFFPFITGKNLAFRALVEISAAAYLALALLYPAYRPKRSILLGALALFVLIVGLADVFGVYPFKSLWSNFERMDGWVTLAHLLLYVVTLAGLLSEKLWKRFLNFELGVSAVVGVYALLQLFGVIGITVGFSSLSRLDATFGNPIYLAVYMLFNVGIAALLWVQAAQNGRRELGWVYGGIAVLDTVILFLTGTRGAMIGLFVGVIIAAVLLLFHHGVSRTVRLTAFSFIAIILFIGGLFALIREQPWVERVPVVNRLATISLTDKTTEGRFYNWGMAWKGAMERPILGWGQENYAIVFDKYYDPRMYAHEQWFDRVHNSIFDWLVAAGFLGLLSYLSLFACAAYCLFRRSFEPIERSVLLGTLAAYFVHTMYSYSTT
jgi:O-antigen ligase